MGKTRTAFIGNTEDDRQAAEQRRKKKEAKLAARKEKGVRVPGLKGGGRVVAVSAEPLAQEPASAGTTNGEQGKKAHQPKRRGKRYLATRLKVDPRQIYPPQQAADLAKQTSVFRPGGRVELHLVLSKPGRFEVQLPHPVTNVKKKIEIANDQTLKKLAAGKIDFDVLITTPEFLPKLVPYARVLGPRGLMPNPKTATIVQDPDAALKRFADGRLVVHTEKDAPITHTVIGSLTDSADTIAQNMEAVLTAVGRQNIKKAVVAATMGPGIKVAIS